MSNSFFPSTKQHDTFVDGLLSWIVENQESFCPPQESEISISEASASSDRMRKCFSELGLALRLVKSNQKISAHPLYLKLCNFWIETAQKRQIFYDMESRPNFIEFYLLNHGTATHLSGNQSASRMRQFNHFLKRGYFTRIERPGWKKIDLAYHLKFVHLECDFGTEDSHLRESSIHRPPSLCCATDLDVYAITHIVFYVTDFGKRPVPEVRQKLGEDMIDYLSLALSTSIAARNCDLVAELLICRLYCGAESELDAVAMHWLMRNQGQDGHVPAQLLLSEKICEFSEIFFHNYHSTLVCLILASVQRKNTEHV